MPINLLSEKGMIRKSLSEKYESLIQKSPLSKFLSDHIHSWFKKTEKFIQQENPYPKFRQQWKILNNEFNKDKSVLNDKAIQEYQRFVSQSVSLLVLLFGIKN